MSASDQNYSALRDGSILLYLFSLFWVRQTICQHGWATTVEHEGSFPHIVPCLVMSHLTPFLHPNNIVRMLVPCHFSFN